MNLYAQFMVVGLFLISSHALPDVDDVYYCQTEVIASIEAGTIEQYESQSFMFHWAEKNLIKFRGESYFEDSQYELSQSYPPLEAFSGADKTSALSFSDGRFRYSSLSTGAPTGRRILSEITSILANCERF